MLKLEGGEKLHKTIQYLTDNKVKVMGHLGMLPQSNLENQKFMEKTIGENQIFKDLDLLKKLEYLLL